MFWVISVYFNIRNTLPKSGTFLLGHPVYTQGVSRLVDITAGGDFLGLCDRKRSYKYVSLAARGMDTCPLFAVFSTLVWGTRRRLSILRLLASGLLCTI